ncbi:MCP four helix bundle domain-containing protein [Mangrovivirga cuniculi]|uniref:Chemotaxis protein n=1 Tax=Mangrovivirga cuniculi TaxID=2715131 RepID=A0A4D7JKF4_9BACT|nr:MCP four helix bundle domain-containing protein [Mangrovivirga cuniculi]QCK16409.1 chemotaxis protein [Mangrovivirga cuniculi]
MTIINKIKWVIAVLLVFLIVLMTNLVDKENFNRLKNSVTTIYEDRVVASDLIFDITLLIQEKEIALATSDTAFFKSKNRKINEDIKDFINKFEQTKLTTEEQETFNNLKTELKKLYSLEEKYADSNFDNDINLFKTIDDIVHDLHDLSKIQLKEGRRQILLSKEAMKTINLFTQVEIIILIILAILIQIIILYKPKED